MPKPLPSDRAGATGDLCAELLPARALADLEAAGVRADGAPRAVVVPMTAPGATGNTATEGCEVRLDGSPLEGAVVRRVFDGRTITQLQKGLKSTTDQLPAHRDGWELRWSDAASAVFALPGRSGRSEAYVMQLVLQRPGVDRKGLVVGLAEDVLAGIASKR